MRFLCGLIVASACLWPSLASATEMWACQAKCGFYNGSIVPLEGVVAGTGFTPLEAFKAAKDRCSKGSFLIKEIALHDEIVWTEATVSTVCVRYTTVG